MKKMPSFAIRNSSFDIFSTRRLAVMNPERFRGIEADFGPEHAETVEMANAEVRMTNRSHPTSAFENRHSNFA